MVEDGCLLMMIFIVVNFYYKGMNDNLAEFVKSLN